MGTIFERAYRNIWTESTKELVGKSRQRFRAGANGSLGPSAAGGPGPRPSRRRGILPSTVAARGGDAGLTGGPGEGNSVVEVLPEQCRAVFG